MFSGLYFTNITASIFITVMVITATESTKTPTQTAKVTTATHQPLNLFTVFILMALMNELRQTISMKIVQGLTHVLETAVSINRIQRFLAFPVSLIEWEDGSDMSSPSRKAECSKNLGTSENYSKSEFGTKSEVGTREENPGYGCKVANLSIRVNKKSSDYILHSINFAATRGSLVVLAGPVGSGKSSLIRAIIQEEFYIEGRVTCPGTVAYAPQTTWIFPGTILENILFGETFDEERFTAVVKACALDKDLENFPKAEKTVVGERGAVLSGGQRARVCLARAVYANADVYLLDDPLSALDVGVGEHVYQNCILELLAAKTRILVTNEISHMKGADRIVLLSKGTVLAEGSFVEMHDSGLLQTVRSTLTDNPPSQKKVGKGPRETHVDSENDGNDKVRFNSSASKSLEIAEEDRGIGTISLNLYWKYLKAGVFPAFVVGALVIFLVSQGRLPFSCYSVFLSILSSLDVRCIYFINQVSVSFSSRLCAHLGYQSEFPIQRLLLAQKLGRILDARIVLFVIYFVSFVSISTGINWQFISLIFQFSWCRWTFGLRTWLGKRGITWKLTATSLSTVACLPQRWCSVC